MKILKKTSSLECIRLQFLKVLIFPRVVWKLQNGVNCSIFSYLKFFCLQVVKMNTRVLTYILENGVYWFIVNS